MTTTGTVLLVAGVGLAVAVIYSRRSAPAGTASGLIVPSSGLAALGMLVPPTPSNPLFFNDPIYRPPGGYTCPGCK